VTDALYHREVMRLAADAVGHGRLASPSGSATITNPLCGDRITVDVRIENGVIKALGHEVRACLLCQAAASMLARRAPGNDPAAVQDIRSEVERWIAAGAAPPDIWPELSSFAPVAQNRSRLRCVTLPFEALERAVAG